MGKTESYLIPGRFALTMGHFLAVLVMYFHLNDIVMNSLADTSTSDEFASELHNLKVAWTVSVVCFVFDFMGLFGGLSIFFRNVNFVQSLLHFLGALYTCWFVLYNWAPEAYWKICALFNLVPAAVEIGIILNIFVFKTIPY